MSSSQGYDRGSDQKNTHEMALALVDDLGHMRQLLAKDAPTGGDIRRISSLLRRILIDNGGDLRKVASPRLNKKLAITAPQLQPLHVSGKNKPWEFLSAGNISVFGISFSTLALETGGQPREIPGFNPDDTTNLSLDNFMAQRIICIKGEWITRRDVVTYVANICHGVHSGHIKDGEYGQQLLSQINRYVRINVERGVPCITVPSPANLNNPASAPPPQLQFNKAELDLALIHLIATAQCLLSSSDIQTLEHTIGQEQFS